LMLPSFGGSVEGAATPAAFLRGPLPSWFYISRDVT